MTRSGITDVEGGCKAEGCHKGAGCSGWGCKVGWMLLLDIGCEGAGCSEVGPLTMVLAYCKCWKVCWKLLDVSSTILKVGVLLIN